MYRIVQVGRSFYVSWDDAKKGTLCNGWFHSEAEARSWGDRHVK